MCIHTYIHAYIHRCTYIHACIHTYIDVHIHAWVGCIQAHEHQAIQRSTKQRKMMRAYKRQMMHQYIHQMMRAYVHSWFRHTYIKWLEHTDIHDSNIHTSNDASMHTRYFDWKLALEFSAKKDIHEQMCMKAMSEEHKHMHIAANARMTDIHIHTGIYIPIKVCSHVHTRAYVNLGFLYAGADTCMGTLMRTHVDMACEQIRIHKKMCLHVKIVHTHGRLSLQAQILLQLNICMHIRQIWESMHACL